MSRPIRTKLKNERNKSDFAYEVGELKDIREKILSGEIEAGTDRTWKSKVWGQWYDFRDDKGEFYQELQKFCEGGQVERQIKMPEIKK